MRIPAIVGLEFSTADFVRFALFLALAIVLLYMLYIFITSRRRLADAKMRMERINIELEQRVEARTEELKATIRELEAFSYSISQDLRAPISAIEGFSKM